MVEAGSGQKLSAWLPVSVKAGEAVSIAVRPENVRLGTNGKAEPNTFTARVAGTRYQGPQTIYELDRLGGRIDALQAQSRRAFVLDLPGLRLKIG